jgi:uncharacterized protein (DUF2267 family)
MPKTMIDLVQKSISEANAWIESIRQELEESSRHRAYSALRATLHAIRDYLTFEDVMELAAHLPPVIRGFYLDGWRHSEGPSKEVEPEDFLAGIAERMIDVRGLDPARAARATFKLLSRKIDEGSLPDVRPTWRHPLAEFWPRPSQVVAPHEPMSETERRRRIERTKEEIRASLAGARQEGAREEELLSMAPSRRNLEEQSRTQPPGAGAGRSPRRAPRERATMTGLDTFDKSVQKLGSWIKELTKTLAWEDSQRAFFALRAVLEALRDRVETDEAFQIAAQLPMILRGFYFEGWDPDRGLTRERTRAEFLMRVLEKLPPDLEVPAENIVRAVFSLLSRRMTRGEVLDIRARLPKPVRELWPDEPTVPDEPRRVRMGAPPSGAPRARARKARKEIRTAIARARAAGVDDRDLPVLVSRRNVRKSSRDYGRREGS